MTGTGRSVVAGQVRAIADAWSPPDAPESWWLTAATFAADRRAELTALCAGHRYQLNEVGRCADVLPVLAAIADGDDRPLAPVDLGTGAGLGLHLDRYHYTYRPAGGPVRPVDTYVHVFLPHPERFDELLAGLGRDLDWISIDPLVPLGPSACTTVQGLDVPEEWVRENREGGVFGVIGRVSIRDEVRTAEVLGRAHPGAAWLEWV